ncbi:hypothetical protein [Chondromyces apiculatus]|uniref:STAS/SEC14 domain-containing protein n=1 Tax=Chondromyces apiculatus DSM 436 TaxID=1192034 RepID=A0A017T1D7_9BACT|nr:hypothetical protein [Chondromyces apiculatus]EYF02822.1 Hypothetical protein CAP_6557 [Chondromyces apiculatus DSM 436]
MQLLATPYCEIQHDPERALVRVTRNERPYQSLDDLDVEISQVGAALAGVKGHWRLMVDLRAVAPRNDPAFEMAVARLRDCMFRHPERIALVVKTAVGALQVKRHVREDHVDAEVFEEETLALGYLLTPGKAARISDRPRGHTPVPRHYTPVSQQYELIQVGRRF